VGECSPYVSILRGERQGRAKMQSCFVSPTMIPEVRHQDCIGYKSCEAFVTATDMVNEHTDFVCANVLLVCGLWFLTCELWSVVRGL
jgi:hypothetical protein